MLWCLAHGIFVKGFVSHWLVRLNELSPISWTAQHNKKSCVQYLILQVWDCALTVMLSGCTGCENPASLPPLDLWSLNLHLLKLWQLDKRAWLKKMSSANSKHSVFSDKSKLSQNSVSSIFSVPPGCSRCNCSPPSPIVLSYTSPLASIGACFVVMGESTFRWCLTMEFERNNFFLSCVFIPGAAFCIPHDHYVGCHSGCRRDAVFYCRRDAVGS